jgi:crotonobetainyl-CoA:carnitine CoA-transferase CaiB-like acyl-CoA transferase
MVTSRSSNATTDAAPPGPLAGIRVIDAGTLFAGPSAAMLLGDFGADVIKVEHPKGDPVRSHGYQKNGIPLWWKVISRNKRAITLNLSKPEGQKLMLGLIEKADVLIESFRPGTLERWNLGPEVLHGVNPKLIVARVTGFGQKGPYKDRPGFGTLAEAMSGFAAITGEPDGPPTLPPFGLADGIAGLALLSAILIALRARELTGRGQIIDLAIIEPILTILGPQPTWYDQLGIVQERLGNRSVNNAPRNIYRTADGRWVAVSASAQNVAERVIRLVGRPEIVNEPWFASGAKRAEHAAELDTAVGSWIAQRTLREVIEQFEEAEAAVAPIYDIREVFKDPQYQALNSIITLQDPDLGPIKMQNVMFRLSDTPGAIRATGRAKGADNELIYGELLGLDRACLNELATKGVI